MILSSSAIVLNFNNYKETLFSSPQISQCRYVSLLNFFLNLIPISLYSSAQSKTVFGVLFVSTLGSCLTLHYNIFPYISVIYINLD